MAVPLVVPDASVLLKWVLPSDDEPDADKTLQLRAAILDDTVHVIVPPFGSTKWGIRWPVVSRLMHRLGYRRY